MLPKVELHIHLDGSIRFETLAELAKRKSLKLPTYEPAALKDHVVTKEPTNLEQILNSFNLFMPAMCGDPDAIERVAYELCQTQANTGVIYFEARFAPHLLCNTVKSDCEWHQNNLYKGHGDIGPDKVLESALRGFQRGGREFGVKWRVILSCMSGYSQWNHEILELCTKYKDQGVIGIDLAGAAKEGQEYIDDTTKTVFEEAKKRGIHRTVHAGEDGTARGVLEAINLLHTNRIGHGYRVVTDEKVYQMARQGGYHFELCPLSSWVCGSVDKDWSKHPARKFVQDRVNFSINTDDPTCFGNSMESEFELCRQKLEFTDDILHECQLNAAKSAFLPENERCNLVNEIKTRWVK